MPIIFLNSPSLSYVLILILLSVSTSSSRSPSWAFIPKASDINSTQQTSDAYNSYGICIATSDSILTFR